MNNVWETFILLVSLCPFMPPRDRTFNGVNGRPKVFLSGRGSFAGTSPTRSTFPSLLSPTTTTSLFYVARSILQPLNLSVLTFAPLFQSVPSRISFRELSFVLSRYFFFHLFTAVHPTFNSHPTTMLYSLTLRLFPQFLRASWSSFPFPCSYPRE